VHATKQSLGPLRSVLRPNTDKAPHFAFTLDLRGQLKGYHAVSQEINMLIDTSVRLPDVFTKLWFSILSSSNLGASSEEWLVTTVRHMVLETLQKSLLSISYEWQRLQVVIVLWCQVVVHELSAVAGLSLLVFSPLAVIDVPDDSVGSYRVCLNHILNSFFLCFILIMIGKTLLSSIDIVF